MNTILYIATGVTGSFWVGVLVGSGLHTMSINRRYQRLATLIQYHNELNTRWSGIPSEHIPPRVSGVW